MLKLNSNENRKIAVRQFVRTFCIFRFEDVSSRELDLLCELIDVGEVSEVAKRKFIMSYETTKQNYAQLINRLYLKGILIKRERRNGKNLHPDILELSNMYINNTDKTKKIMFLEWRST